MRRILAVLAVAVCLAGVGATAETEGDFDTLMDQAQTLLRSNRAEEAIRVCKRAIKLNPSSGDAYWRLAQAYHEAHAYKDVETSCQRGLQVAETDRLRAIFHAILGEAYEDQAVADNDRNNLILSEHEYREAASLSPAPTLVHFQLGRVLMRMGRDEEGITELKLFLNDHREDPDHPAINAWIKTAEQLIANPRRAREPFIPDFSLTTADGRYISSDDLAGKIIVLDFWGIWCPPCRDSVPEMRSMVKRFANDPVVVLGISTDNDEVTWRKFIADNKMDWPQYIDTDHRMTRLFGVQSYPTYLMVDAEGILRKVEHGSGSLVWIQDEVKKRLKTMAKDKAEGDAGRPQ